MAGVGFGRKLRHMSRQTELFGKNKKQENRKKKKQEFYGAPTLV